MMKRSLVGLVAALAACKGSNAPPDASAPDASPMAEASVAVPSDPVIDSLVFLAAIDKLMEGYVPPLPASRDDTDLLRCVTSRALQSDPALHAAGSKLVVRKKDALKEREKRLQELYALSFRVDVDWKTKQRSISEVRSCWADGELQYDDCCASDGECGPRGWRVDVPASQAYLYSQSSTPPLKPPELMLRIEAASLPIPHRFSCRVEDVSSEKMLALTPAKVGSLVQSDVFVPQMTSFVVVDCASATKTDVVLRLSGEVPNLNAGDVVSVPLAGVARPDGVLMKTPGERELRWTVDAEGSSLTVDKPATCPSTSDILAAAKR